VEQSTPLQGGPSCDRDFIAKVADDALT